MKPITRYGNNFAPDASGWIDAEAGLFIFDLHNAVEKPIKAKCWFDAWGYYNDYFLPVCDAIGIGQTTAMAIHR